VSMQDESPPSDPGRRRLFKAVGAAGVATALPMLPAQAKQQAAPAQAYIFLNPAEAAFVEAAVERLIPSDEAGPGAKDAGVALLIDKAVVADPTLTQPFRAGIADLNAVALTAYNAKFADLTEEQQVTVLTPLSLDPSSSLGNFFNIVKDMTVDAYYKTEAGLKTELGWHGNTYLAEFKGCNHPEHQS